MAAIIEFPSAPTQSEHGNSPEISSLNNLALEFYHRVASRQVRSACILEVDHDSELTISCVFAPEDGALCHELIQLVHESH